MSVAICPECESNVVPPENPAVHEIIECADCRAELEIVIASPLMLALAPEVEEDWGE